MSGIYYDAPSSSLSARSSSQETHILEGLPITNSNVHPDLKKLVRPQPAGSFVMTDDMGMTEPASISNAFTLRRSWMPLKLVAINDEALVRPMPNNPTHGSFQSKAACGAELRRAAPPPSLFRDFQTSARLTWDDAAKEEHLPDLENVAGWLNRFQDTFPGSRSVMLKIPFTFKSEDGSQDQRHFLVPVRDGEAVHELLSRHRSEDGTVPLALGSTPSSAAVEAVPELEKDFKRHDRKSHTASGRAKLETADGREQTVPVTLHSMTAVLIDKDGHPYWDNCSPYAYMVKSDKDLSQSVARDITTAGWEVCNGRPDEATLCQTLDGDKYYYQLVKHDHIQNPKDYAHFSQQYTSEDPWA